MPRKSSTAYPADWDQIALDVKDRAGWRCVRCGHPHDAAQGYLLTVHHLDLSPANCAWWNLAALCQRCHLSIQSRVIMERTWLLPHSEWFRPFVAGYYAHQAELPEDREYVMQRLDDLIAIGQGNTALATELKEQIS
jgi:5-methylcytosine-specific restriction endonuclease McrA